MRSLIVMRGLPGSGKSTLVRNAGLEAYSVELDKLRLMARSPALDDGGVLRVPQAGDAYVWHLVQEVLERRMRHGDTTVVDATSTRTDSLRNLARMARRWRYRMAVVTMPATLDQCAAFSASRPALEQVPEDVMARMADQLAVSHVPKGCDEVRPNAMSMRSWLPSLSFAPIDDGYDRVKVIGDVHGCDTALGEAIPEGVGADPGCLYVFVGDLFDRGLESGRLLRRLAPVVSNRNVVFVEGNHERHVVDHVMGTETVNRDGTRRVTRHFRASYADMCEALGHDEVERLLRVIVHRLVPYLDFRFAGRRYLVTHGGLSSVPSDMGLVSDDDCVFGVGDYDTQIDQLFEASGNQDDVIQVHGHRRTMSTAHSVCLESGVEFGGRLSVLVIEPGGDHVERTANAVFDHDLRPYGHMAPKGGALAETADATTNAIMASPWVRARREPSHDLVSLAFTQKAFARNHWDEQTTRARGLFVDAVTGDVRLRAYDKFFGIGERPETEMSALARTMRFPAQAWRKENGFLGIMGVVDGDVVLATKGSTTGDYARRFARVFGLLGRETRDTLAKLARDGCCSLLFEVLAADDEHIIWHDGNELVFLDAVRNSYDVGGTNVDPGFSTRVRAFVPTGDPHLRVKSLEADLDGIDDLADWLAEHAHDRSMEGVVVCDANGFMVKVKLPYYRAVKRLRGAMRVAQTQARRGLPMPRSFAAPHDSPEMACVVSMFMSELLEDPCWKDAHVIGASHDFEERHGIDLSHVDSERRD